MLSLPLLSPVANFDPGAPVCLDYIGVAVLWHGTADSRAATTAWQ